MEAWGGGWLGGTWGCHRPCAENPKPSTASYALTQAPAGHLLGAVLHLPCPWFPRVLEVNWDRDTATVDGTVSPLKSGQGLAFQPRLRLSLAWELKGFLGDSRTVLCF